jgi:heme a synthase
MFFKKNLQQFQNFAAGLLRDWGLFLTVAVTIFVEVRTMTFSKPLQQLQKWTLGALIYNIIVMIWGAFVRATGSGAGCGDHWPLCNGQVVPRAPQMETLIEFTHRLTSGVALLVVFYMCYLAFRAVEKHHPLRRWAALSVVFIVIEALIGAAIVLLRLVGTDASLTRGVSMSFHLVNTFLLLGALSMTCALSFGWLPNMESTLQTVRSPDERGEKRNVDLQLFLPPFLKPALCIGLFLLVLVGASGAIAALGNTLFPARPYGAAPELQRAVEHLFVELRVVHPFVSLLGAAWWSGLAFWVGGRSEDRIQTRISLAVFAVFVLQIALGVVNVALRAPVWMQLTHLFAADLAVCACATMTAALWHGVLAKKVPFVEGAVSQS